MPQGGDPDHPDYYRVAPQSALRQAEATLDERQTQTRLHRWVMRSFRAYLHAAAEGIGAAG